MCDRLMWHGLQGCEIDQWILTFRKSGLPGFVLQLLKEEWITSPPQCLEGECGSVGSILFWSGLGRGGFHLLALGFF